MPDRFVVRGRNNFTLPLRHPTDVQTAWVVFCTGDYYLPRHCETVLDLAPISAPLPCTPRAAARHGRCSPLNRWQRHSLRSRKT